MGERIIKKNRVHFSNYWNSNFLIKNKKKIAKGGGNLGKYDGGISILGLSRVLWKTETIN